VPRSLSLGLKTRPSAPNEGERQTALSIGSRLTKGIGDRCAPGSPFFASFFGDAKKEVPVADCDTKTLCRRHLKPSTRNLNKLSTSWVYDYSSY